MNPIVKQLQLINNAIYTNQPIPPTQRLSQLINDQLIKKNTQLIDIFTIAPLTLQALSGKMTIQLQIFKNGFQDPTWLKILDILTIQNLFFKAVNSCNFTLKTDADKIEKQREIESIYAIFGMEINNYETIVNYILKCAELFIQGSFQSNFNQIFSIVKLGLVIDFSPSYNNFLIQLFRILSPFERQNFATKIIDFLPHFTPQILPTIEILTKFTQMNGFQQNQQRVSELLQVLAGNLQNSSTAQICENIYSAQILSMSKKLLKQGAPDFDQVVCGILKQVREVLNYACCSQNSLYSLKMPINVQEIDYQVIYCQLKFLINCSQVIFGKYIPPFYMATSAVVDIVRQNQFLYSKFAELVGQFKSTVPNQFYYGNISLEDSIKAGVIKATDKKLETGEFITKVAQTPQISQQAFKPLISNINIHKVEPVQKQSLENSTFITGLTSFAEDSIMSEIINKRSESVRQEANIINEESSSKLEVTKMQGESILQEDSKMELDLKFV